MDDHLKDIKKKATTENAKDIDKLIRSKLPDSFDFHDLKWRLNDMVYGAKTLYYKDEPVITLFPIETETVEENHKVKLKITQRYLDHTEES